MSDEGEQTAAEQWQHWADGHLVTLGLQERDTPSHGRVGAQQRLDRALTVAAELGNSPPPSEMATALATLEGGADETRRKIEVALLVAQGRGQMRAFAAVAAGKISLFQMTINPDDAEAKDIAAGVAEAAKQPAATGVVEQAISTCDDSECLVHGGGAVRGGMGGGLIESIADGLSRGVARAMIDDFTAWLTERELPDLAKLVGDGTFWRETVGRRLRELAAPASKGNA